MCTVPLRKIRYPINEYIFRFFELDTCKAEKNITLGADDEIKTINITKVGSHHADIS